MTDCLRLNDNGTTDYKEVEKQWIAFSNRRTLYDQIRFIDVEGNEVIREASKWSPELAAACEVWKEIKFEFEAMDVL